MIIARIRHLIEWCWTIHSPPARRRNRIAELQDELARERGQRQIDRMLHEAEVARLIRCMARIQLKLHQRDTRPNMLDGVEP